MRYFWPLFTVLYAAAVVAIVAMFDLRPAELLLLGILGGFLTNLSIAVWEAHG